MIVFYLIAAFAAGSEFVATLSGDMSPYLYAVMSAMNFAVGVTIVYSGVRMICLLYTSDYLSSSYWCHNMELAYMVLGDS